MKSALNTRFFLPIAFLATIYLLFSGCSQKKNTFTSRTFHNLAAHYNGLYWANVSLDEGIYNLDKAHKDNYDKILPVFRYADEKAAKANEALFDRAIEKTNKVIQYHSMLIKDKEYCRWIDENYMTMGRAHFYKRDYYAAVVVFEYVVKRYPNNPSRYEAFLWLVRSYNQMNSVIRTGPILDLLKHDKKMPRYLIDDYQSVLSDYYLRTEQFAKAEEALQRAVVLTKKKRVRGRYLFILAQLYEQDGDLKKASESYSRSAKFHPSYEMEFNARLAKARTFQVTAGTNTKELKKELHKMLKDEKNKEYKDQIYFALANISYRENDVYTALDYYKLSALSSIANTRQKAISFLNIAEIYFDRKNYKSSQAYYDSTMAFLPKDYVDYEQIRIKKESLTAMIKDITIISHQDSLLRVATMDTVQIGKIIDGIIAKLVKDEEQKKKDDEIKALNQAAGGGSLFNENNPWGNSTGPGLWYFYNSTSKFSGVAEFYKKWGNRTLEDDWRRNSKEVIMATQVQDTVKVDTASGKIADNKTRAYYLKNIPFKEEQKVNSKKKIIDAYYDLGNIYKEDLQDPLKAIETFEELLAKYPDNKYSLNLYYQLYRLYIGQNNDVRSNIYKEKILSKFPNSEYAKIIQNPEYQKLLKASRNEIEDYYENTYAAYNSGKYGDVIAMVSKADSFYSASQLMPKFAMLRAYSIGKTQTKVDYENALQGVIAKYPKDKAKEKAQELLDYLKGIKNIPVSPAVKKDTVQPLFSFKDSAEHQCIIVLDAKKLDVDDFKKRVSNFNADYFNSSNLDISNIMMGTETHIIIIKSFVTSTKAKDYFDLIDQDAKVFKGIARKEYEIFPITPDNFSIFYKEKKMAEYKSFFEQYYLAKRGE